MSNEGAGCDDPRIYRMVSPVKAEPRPCPVEGSSGWVATRTEIMVTFWHRHVWDTMMILEEGNPPHLRCPLCDMLMLWRLLNGIHRHTANCKRGEERKQRSLAVEEKRQVTSMAFSAYERSLDMVTYFQ